MPRFNPAIAAKNCKCHVCKQDIFEGADFYWDTENRFDLKGVSTSTRICVACQEKSGARGVETSSPDNTVQAKPTSSVIQADNPQSVNPSRFTDVALISKVDKLQKVFGDTRSQLEQQNKVFRETGFQLKPKTLFAVADGSPVECFVLVPMDMTKYQLQPPPKPAEPPVKEKPYELTEEESREIDEGFAAEIAAIEERKQAKYIRDNNPPKPVPRGDYDCF